MVRGTLPVGPAALVVDAYRPNGHGDPAPIDVLNTLEATAHEASDPYTPATMGAGFVDARAAVERAANGNLASFSDVTLAES